MRQCTICEKGSIMRTSRKLLRGHYNPVNRKRKYPNLQWLTIADQTRIRACAQCIKGVARGKVSVTVKAR